MTGVRVQARPRGVATGVVFDWALTVQLTTQAIAAATGHLGLTREPVTIAGRLLAALFLLAVGEALRRGVKPLRLVETAIVAVVTVLGIAGAALLVAGHGDRGLVFSVVIELTVAPYLAWALLQQQTSAWFAAAGPTRTPAPRTVGGSWLAVLVAWSIVSGLVVAWSQSL